MAVERSLGCTSRVLNARPEAGFELAAKQLQQRCHLGQKLSGFIRLAWLLHRLKHCGCRGQQCSWQRLARSDAGAGEQCLEHSPALRLQLGLC
jgi:hypothetical protein